MAQIREKHFFAAAAVIALLTLWAVGIEAFQFTPSAASNFTTTAQANLDGVGVVKIAHINGTATLSQTLAVNEGWLFKVVTIPHVDGTVALQDNWDLELKDQFGVDILGGGALNRDQTNAEQAWPLQGTDQHAPVFIHGPLTFTVTNNNVDSINSATYLYIKDAP